MRSITLSSRAMFIGTTVSALAMAAMPGECGAQREPHPAKSGARLSIDQPAEQLSDALVSLGRAAGREIIFSPTDVEGQGAPPLKGIMTIEDAVASLLAGTGLSASFDGGTILIRARSETEAAPEILVTGSRIRGAAPASPVIRVTREAVRDAGQSNLGEAVRSLSQNFNGGQNPGVGGGIPGADNVNINSASSPNLRGLGPDATLTLVNGRRLAYGGVNNAVDISAIPLDAVERVEMVADGASALYGSDAIGGVVNVILRRDYDGLALSGRVGAATDGGNVERQLSATVGTTWSDGGLVAAFDAARNSAIIARQRAYAERQQDGTTLYPEIRSKNALMSAHQRLGVITLSLDAMFGTRNHRIQTPFSGVDRFDQFGTLSRSNAKRFSIAPQLAVDLPQGWSLEAGLVRGKDRTRLSTILSVGGVAQYDTRICYCNSLTSAEIGAGGGLFALPAGMVRLALGGGWRETVLDQQRRRISLVGAPLQQSLFKARQESWYGYGELSVPLVSPGMAIPAIERATLSAALRYENYPGMGEVATPKFGLVLSPSPDLEFKASWGRSFKAPTLYQRFLDQQALLLNAEGIGEGQPAGSTIVYLAGGNRDLKPERSTSWTASLALHPRALDGFEIELSYFDIRYSRRVIEPIFSAAGVLDDPIYRDLVTLAPGRATIDAVVAASALGLSNQTGRPYDPGSVVAIIDNRFTNAARQRAKGLDVAARYRFDLKDSAIDLMAGASYLSSRRRLIDTQPYIKLAGTIFDPPHWRARAGATWSTGRLSLSGWLSHIAGVTDDRRQTPVDIAGQTTLDLTLRYQTPPGQVWYSNMEFALTAQNLLNDKPDLIRTDQVQYTPYDSTNYSAIGRFVGLTVTKRWQ